MPRWSANIAWVPTQSFTVTVGKSAPQGWPLAALMESGPVLPPQPPGLFTATTNSRVVSMGLPGPMQASHQPGLRSSAWW